jgi:hypothetical protein
MYRTVTITVLVCIVHTGLHHQEQTAWKRHLSTVKSWREAPWHDPSKRFPRIWTARPWDLGLESFSPAGGVSHSLPHDLLVSTVPAKVTLSSNLRRKSMDNVVPKIPLAKA